MTKKSRRSRVKHKRRGSRKPLAVKEAGQSPQVLPLSPKQASVAKSTATLEQATLYRNVLSEIKRSLTIAAVLLVLLIVLYFFLR
jgi:hypothetical protein